MFAQFLGTALVVVAHLMSCSSVRKSRVRIGSLNECPWSLFMGISLSSLLSLLHSTCHWNSLQATSIALLRSLSGRATEALHEQYIFWLGPLIGSLLACFLYRLLKPNDERGCTSFSGYCNDTLEPYFDRTVPDEETTLNVLDFHRARALGSFNFAPVNDTAMYNAKRFEGDIVNAGFDPRSAASFYTQHPLFSVFGVQRNAVKQTYLKWTDGRIPYTISSQYSSYSRSKIAEAIEEYKKKTCIEFSPKSAADQDYIHIVPDDGCYSLVGRIGRADRDDHVTINWSNVESGLQDQFDKYSLQMIDHLDTDYDYGSVMHYAPTAFSKNGKPTIEPRKKGVEIGQRYGFSETDLYKINKLYNCKKDDEDSTDVPETGTIEKSEEEEADIKTDTKRPSGSGKLVGSSTGEKSNSIISTHSKTCADRRRDCQFLARAGHCESRFSEAFMAENCPQSCGKCEVKTTEAPKPCEDLRTWCERWAISGMCTQQIFKDYMKIKCPKSCQYC
ncbi:unnamed protein product [Cylicocyclus nassatus]|uniref:Metalloendopeptidase n=1 Tax=Cylicocyclus nassatus TaxID=53992 RepID=A0AA36HEG1_CYLNA|nr:unnamed protein product [Cylicocyclus nassatus]